MIFAFTHVLIPEVSCAQSLRKRLFYEGRGGCRPCHVEQSGQQVSTTGSDDVPRASLRWLFGAVLSRGDSLQRWKAARFQEGGKHKQFLHEPGALYHLFVVSFHALS